MAPGMGRKLGGGRIVLNSVAVINSPRTEPGALKESNQPPFGLAGPPLITSSPSHSIICSRSHCLYLSTPHHPFLKCRGPMRVLLYCFILYIHSTKTSDLNKST